VRRKALVLSIACAGALTVAGAALAGNGGLLPPAPHSPNAERIRQAYIFVLVFAAIVFVVVEGILLTMIAPADNVVHEDVSAPATDVVHSWWVPELGGKIDAIPGRANHTWFQAPAGDYAARCSDLCGIQHTLMTAVVRVVPRAAYEAFIAGRAANPTSIALGREEYVHVCAVCHKLNAVYVGPALGGNPLLTDAKGLTTILREGFGTMPAVGSDWTDDQITALVRYTTALARHRPSGG